MSEFTEGDNIAIRLDESTGLVDIDLDSPVAIKLAPKFLPRCGMVFGRKGAPNSHWVYRCEGHIRPAIKIMFDANGSDNRKDSCLLEWRTGSKHYTVFPPGRHEGTDEHIEWSKFDPELITPAGELSEAFSRLSIAVLLAEQWPRHPGQRDAKWAMPTIGGLVRLGWSDEHIETLLRAVCSHAGDEQVNEYIKKTAASRKKYQAGQNLAGFHSMKEEGRIPATMLDTIAELYPKSREAETAGGETAGSPEVLEGYRPFPLHCLPGGVREYVVESAAYLGADPAYIALPVLGTLAGLIGVSRVARVNETFRVPGILWTMLIAPSGAGKTPALRFAREYISVIQRRLDQQNKSEQAEYEVTLDKWKRDCKTLDPDEDPEPKPEKPAERCVLTNDTTIERIAEKLQDNPKGMMLVSDELKTWLESFRRHGKGDYTSNWLSIRNGEEFRMDRRSGDIHVPMAACSVVSAIQPGILYRAMSQEFMDSGFLARFLVANPPPRAKQLRRDNADPEGKARYEKTKVRYEAILEYLHSLQPLGFHDDPKPGEDYYGPRPVVIDLTNEALDRYEPFYNEYSEKAVDSPDHIGAALSKLEQTPVELALVHQLATAADVGEQGCVEIGVESMEAGLELARWFTHEMYRLYQRMDSTDEEKQYIDEIDFIREQVATKGRLSASNFFKRFKKKYKKKTHSDDQLDKMVKAGLIALQEQPASADGGKPGKYIVLSGTITHNPITPITSENASPKPPLDDKSVDHNPITSQTPNGVPDREKSERDHSEEGLWVMGYGPRVQNQKTEITPQKTPSRLWSDGDHNPITHPKDDPSESSTDLSNYPEPQEFTLVTDGETLAEVVAAVSKQGIVCIDLETSGLDPNKDTIRLIQLHHPQIGTFVVDCFRVDVAPFLAKLCSTTLVGHNIKFDLMFLVSVGCRPSKACCTMLMSLLVDHQGRGTVSLFDACKKHLGVEIDKSQQKSDWLGELTDDQLRYAANDVVSTWKLYESLAAEIEKTGQGQAASIENAAVPFFAWMELGGIPFDEKSWLELHEKTKHQLDETIKQLDALAPHDPERFEGMAQWSWSSHDDVKRVFQLLGFELPDTKDQTMATIDHPFADLFREYRGLSKAASSYGEAWTKLEHDGRLFPHWFQVGARSGRSSCRNPNIQQIKRGSEYRKCFHPQEGSALVRCDYSQIELRVAAELAGETKLIDAFRRGDDVHKLTASLVTGRAPEDVSKAERQQAKALNFGLLFGMSAKTFRVNAKANYGLRLSLEEAESLRNRFFKAYPKLRQWHKRQGKSGTMVRTRSGRIRGDIEPSDNKYTQRLNSPVQGVASDGLKAALGLMWLHRDELPRSAKPVGVVHDEVLFECKEGDAEAVKAFIEKYMVKGMETFLKKIPIAAEGEILATWGG